MQESKHVTIPFSPLHLSDALDLTSLQLALSLCGALAKSMLSAKSSLVAARGMGAKCGGARPNSGSFGPKAAPKKKQNGGYTTRAA